MNCDNVAYFYRFGVEHIPNQKFIECNHTFQKCVDTFVDIAFIDFFLKRKTLLDYTNEYKKNDKIIFKNFELKTFGDKSGDEKGLLY